MTQQRAAPTQWLSVFEIGLTSASNLLYANGRQQVQVSIKVEARPGQTISDTEMKSICVVVLNNDGIYFPVPSAETPTTQWWFSETRNEYNFYASAATSHPFGYFEQSGASFTPNLAKSSSTAGKLSRREKAVRTKDFYLMTKSPGGTTNTFYAQITRDDGETYVTDEVFTTNVQLTSVKVPAYSATQDYELNMALISGSENSGIFVYECLLSHNFYSFYSAQMNPSGMIQWDDKDPGVTHASVVGHAGPGLSTIQYDETIKLATGFDGVSFVSSPTPGKLTIVLQGDINIPYISDCANLNNGPCFISAIDSNGNGHDLRVKFKGETGFENRVDFTLMEG